MQYSMLTELEKILAEFCQWSLSHEKNLRPDQATIDSYSSYLTSYQLVTDQQGPQSNEKPLEPYVQAGVPIELAKKMVFVGGISDFPLLVSLCAETEKDFMSVVAGFNNMRDFLGLQKISQQLIKLPLQGYWERKLLTDTREDLKHLTGLLVKSFLLSPATSSPDYFRLMAKSQKIKRYQRIYQEIMRLPPINLLPYIALVRALGRLTEDDAQR